jgi:hypothetical protein
MKNEQQTFVTVDKNKLMQCLTKLDYPENAIDDCVDKEYKLLTQSVTVNYQKELDYFLEHQEILQSKDGLEIQKIMDMNFGKFLDSLQLYSLGLKV